MATLGAFDPPSPGKPEHDIQDFTSTASKLNVYQPVFVQCNISILFYFYYYKKKFFFFSFRVIKKFLWNLNVRGIIYRTVITILLMVYLQVM